MKTVFLLYKVYSHIFLVCFMCDWVVMIVKNAGKSIKYFAAGIMILVWYQI